MSAIFLAMASIRNRILSSCLSIIAIASGIALLTVIYLLSNGVQRGLERNAEGIDIVAGAKGSPVQLVLSAIYHSDIPNGNIEIKDYEQLLKNPQIKQVIPVAMGDNYKGWRIVGTTHDYLANYQAQLTKGRVFEKPFEVVAGALTGLKIGDEFAALHGFAAESDDVHDFHLYKVVGVLKSSGMVIDRLIITSVESVQELHSHPNEHDHDAHEEMALGHQITAALIKVKSPVAVMNLPREINKSTNILATSPSYQIARLSQSMGYGRDVLMVLAIGMLGLSIMMLFSILASSLSTRRYDMAILRAMGASSWLLAKTIVSEGIVISILGSLLGLVLGHMGAAIMASMLPSLGGIVLPKSLLLPSAIDIVFLVIGVAAGLLGGIIPAVLAARTDVAVLLSKGKT